MARTRKNAEVVVPLRRPARSLTASAAQVDLGDRTEAERVKKWRQGWQEDAWAYRDSVPELGYAMRFIANSVGRMRLFIGVYVNPEDEQPTPLKDSGLPPKIQAICEDALARLGGSRLAVTALLKPLSENWEVSGECWLVGIEDPDTHLETWGIYSTDELQVRDGLYWIIDEPGAQINDKTATKLDPGTSFVVRMWNPHPRWRKLADCPMRQLLDVCEELMILSRDIRAAGRSRLAGNGILKVPTGLTIGGADDAQAEGNETEDPFMRELTDAMTAPIQDEGVASAVVPIVVRGEAELLKAMEHLPISRPVDATSAKTRDELRGRIATGLDLPNQVIEGTADLNHWSAWQVDDNTFRHHLEPKVISYVDALTVGYLRTVLEGQLDVDTIQKIVMWYDPTELVTHPDRSADARDLWDRNILSDEGLLLACGWTEKDKPSAEEFMVRLIAHTKTWDPGLVAAIIHRIDPSLPVTVPPGEVPVKAPGPAPTPDNEPEPDQPTQGAPPEPGNQPKSSAPPAAARARPGSMQSRPATGYLAPTVTAGGVAPKVVNHGLSRKLVDIDRSLRDRMTVAAEATLVKQLERAGARLRTKTQGNAKAKALATTTNNRWLVAAMGPALVATLGTNERELMQADFSDLKVQWDGWVASSQAQALKVAGRLAGVAPDDPRLLRASQKMGRDAGAAWVYLEASLRKIAVAALYNPRPTSLTSAAPKLTIKSAIDLDDGPLVEPGTMRAAIAIAGGFGTKDTSAGIGPDQRPVQPGEPMGQIGTGDTITEFLSSADVEQSGYVWIHGDSDNPFPDHEALDGIEFMSFTDPVLDGSFFSGYDCWIPGDHGGCTCDWMPLWATNADNASALDAILPTDSADDSA